MRSLALILALAAAHSGSQTATRLEVTAPIGGGVFAHVWTAPARGGGECFFLTLGRRQPTHAPAAPKGCTRVDHLRPTTANRVAYTIVGPARSAGRTVVYGEIEALAPVARLAVLRPGAPLPITVNGRWFLGVLPPLRTYKHWRLVAYGRRGEILGRVYF